MKTLLVLAFLALSPSVMACRQNIRVIRNNFIADALKAIGQKINEPLDQINAVAVPEFASHATSAAYCLSDFRGKVVVTYKNGIKAVAVVGENGETTVSEFKNDL